MPYFHEQMVGFREKEPLCIFARCQTGNKTFITTCAFTHAQDTMRSRTLKASYLVANDVLKTYIYTHTYIDAYTHTYIYTQSDHVPLKRPRSWFLWRSDTHDVWPWRGRESFWLDRSFESEHF